MKAAMSILLLVLLTTTQTPLGQLWKLPLLIEHFYKHNKQEGVSLLKFLIDHYSAQHKDADQSEDEQLPFKTVMLENVAFAIVPNILKIHFPLTFNIPIEIMLKEIYTPQQHLCAIFHPPRHCALV